MVRRTVLIVLGAGLLLISEQHSGTLQALSAARPSLRTGQVFRDRMKIGTDGPEMIVIPAGKFRMGDIRVGASRSSNRCTKCIFAELLRSAGTKSLLINTTSLLRQLAANHQMTKVLVGAAGQ